MVKRLLCGSKEKGSSAGRMSYHCLIHMCVIIWKKDARDIKMANNYWFDDSGAMATGWKEINDQWEMFADSGAWLYTWQGN